MVVFHCWCRRPQLRGWRLPAAAALRTYFCLQACAYIRLPVRTPALHLWLRRQPLPSGAHQPPPAQHTWVVKLLQDVGVGGVGRDLLRLLHRALHACRKRVPAMRREHEGQRRTPRRDNERRKHAPRAQAALRMGQENYQPRGSPLAGSVSTSCAPKAWSITRRSSDIEAGIVRMSL